MFLVLPVGLEKKLNGLDAADPFIGSDNQDVVENECIRYGVRVKDRDNSKTEK